jgi:hypothetical protein
MKDAMKVDAEEALEEAIEQAMQYVDSRRCASPAVARKVSVDYYRGIEEACRLRAFVIEQEIEAESKNR